MFGFFEGIYSFLTRQIGLRTDAADAAGSLHAKVADAKSSINTNTNSKIGTSSDTRASNTVMGWLNTQIKSVQRGVTLINAASYTATATITAVTTTKATVKFLGMRTGGDYTHVAHVVLTNSTTITLTKVGTTNDVYVSWEVVEYY